MGSISISYFDCRVLRWEELSGSSNHQQRMLAVLLCSVWHICCYYYDCWKLDRSWLALFGQKICQNHHGYVDCDKFITSFESILFAKVNCFSLYIRWGRIDNTWLYFAIFIDTCVLRPYIKCDGWYHSRYWIIRQSLHSSFNLLLWNRNSTSCSISI